MDKDEPQVATLGSKPFIPAYLKRDLERRPISRTPELLAMQNMASGAVALPFVTSGEAMDRAVACGKGLLLQREKFQEHTDQELLARASESVLVSFLVSLANKCTTPSVEPRHVHRSKMKDLPKQRQLRSGERLSLGFAAIKGDAEEQKLKGCLMDTRGDTRLTEEGIGKLVAFTETFLDAAAQFKGRNVVARGVARVRQNELRSHMMNGIAHRLNTAEGAPANEPSLQDEPFSIIRDRPLTAGDAFLVEVLQEVDLANKERGGSVSKMDFEHMATLDVSVQAIYQKKLYTRSSECLRTLLRVIEKDPDQAMLLEEVEQAVLESEPNDAFFFPLFPFTIKTVAYLETHTRGRVLLQHAETIAKKTGLSSEEVFERGIQSGGCGEDVQKFLRNALLQKRSLSATLLTTMGKNHLLGMFFEVQEEEDQDYRKAFKMSTTQEFVDACFASPEAIAWLAESIQAKTYTKKSALPLTVASADRLCEAGYVAEAFIAFKEGFCEKALKRDHLMDRARHMPEDVFFANLERVPKRTFAGSLIEQYKDEAHLARCVPHLEKFFGVSDDIYGCLCAQGYEHEAETHLGVFRSLKAERADALIEKGHIREVYLNKQAFLEFSPQTNEKIQMYDRLLEAIRESPSRTVRRMQQELAVQLLSSEHPEEDFTRIERIFLRNHIPLVGKIFLTFDTLYKDAHFEKRVYSPTLLSASPREGKMLIYKDLINIHLDTGNPSLKAYLEEMQAMLPILGKLETQQTLDAQASEKAQAFFRKAEVLHDVSLYGKVRTAEVSQGDLAEQARTWKKALGAREGQTTHERLEEMFLRPAGVASIEEALARMEASKKRADTRNRELVKASPEGIHLQEGDLLKGVDAEYFLSYLQNGNVSGESLGCATKDDSTRLDADTGKVLAEDAEQGNKKAFEVNPAKDYGDGMVLVLRPTSERFFSDARSVHDQIRGKTPPYELFSSPVVDPERHFGIRTGISFTDVRAIMLKDPEPRLLLDLKMDLIANGYYVPIIDIEGKFLFTPEEFDELKTRAFSGTKITNEAFLLEKITRSEEDTRVIEALQTAIAAEHAAIERVRSAIDTRIKEVLAKVGVALRLSDELAVGAELLHTGSTARHTSIVGETVDFDIAIRLDENDLARQEEIQQALDELMQGEVEDGGTSQWRRKGVDVDGVAADIDITFVGKSEAEGMSSHEVIEQRLASIDHTSQAEGDWVRANIVLAKQILKKAGVYKSVDGGLGGIGVESWILQNGGSFAKARETLLAAAIDEEGNVRSFEACAERYLIPNAGMNIVEHLDGDLSKNKSHRHANFFASLNQQGGHGYLKMVETLKNM